jgi:hypothetical protein
MNVEIGNKALMLIVVAAFAVIFPVIFLIDWLDEDVVNPRIWEGWPCDRMLRFAVNGDDEGLSDFQRAQFHEDLSHCLES